MRIPTSYNTGLYSQGKLSAVSPFLTPMDAGQAVPRALANLGQQIESTATTIEKLDNAETYRQQTADFKQTLATTQADLAKRQEDLSKDASIPEDQKAARFAEYAKEKEKLLFENAPKHIQQDYQASYTNMVTPMQLQTQNAAQASMTMEASKNAVLATEKAKADITAIAQSGGLPQAREQLFNDYISQTLESLTMQGVSTKDQAAIKGQMLAQAQHHFNTELLNQTKSEALAAMDGNVQVLINSSAAATDPVRMADQVRQAVENGGRAGGLNSLQILDMQQKAVSQIWGNAAHKLFNDADQNKGFGPKLAADKKLLQLLQAQDDKGNFLFGGTDYQLQQRQGMISTVQNRMEANERSVRAEALARQPKAVTMFDFAQDPLATRAKAAGVALVPIDVRNPAGSMQARIKQAAALNSDVILTSKEASSLGEQFMKMKTPQQAFGWLGQLVSSAPPKQAKDTLRLVAGQVEAANPTVARSIDLYANGMRNEAINYYQGRQLMRLDGSNPELDKRYKTSTAAVRSSLAGILPQSAIESYADIVAVLENQPGADSKKVRQSVIGTVNTKGKWNPLVPNSSYVVPPGYDPDKVSNFFSNPDAKTAQVLGTDIKTIKRATPVTTAEGYLLKNPDTNEPIYSGGMPVLIPFNLFGSK